MKTILLTGSDGFVGSVLRRALMAQGYRVVGTVFGRAPEEGEVRLDLTRPDGLDDLPAQTFDAVIHTAGVVDQRAPRELMYAVNADGTRRLLDWCARHGCGHFIQISSIAVYGLRAVGQQRREDTTETVGMVGVPYQKSKALAEHHVRASGLPFTLLRLPPVVGAGDSFFSPVVMEALQQGRYFFCGGRNPLVSVLNVENLPGLLAWLIEQGATDQAFNAACHHVPWGELLQAYADCMGLVTYRRTLPLAHTLRHLNDKRFLLLLTSACFGAHFPNDRLRAVYGWRPAFGWREGVVAAVVAAA